MSLNPPKAIGLKKAMDLMHRTGTRLVKMHSSREGGGFSYYLVPGGYVEPITAEKIKGHPYVQALDDGLFPGHDQTWRLLTEISQEM